MTFLKLFFISILLWVSACAPKKVEMPVVEQQSSQDTQQGRDKSHHGRPIGGDCSSERLKPYLAYSQSRELFDHVLGCPALVWRTAGPTSNGFHDVADVLECNLAGGFGFSHNAVLFYLPSYAQGRV